MGIFFELAKHFIIFVRIYVHKIKQMKEITAAEFRNKQAQYLDMVDNGEQIVVSRGKRRKYVLTPLSDEDIYFTPEMIQKIERSKEQVKKGKVTKIKGADELNQYLENL